MREIEQYIISKLNKLKELSVNLSYKYAYDKNTDFHVVEIEPCSLIEENDAVFDVVYDIETEVRNTYSECNFILAGKKPYRNMANILYKYSSLGLTLTKPSIGRVISSNLDNAAYDAANNYALAA